MSIQMALDLPQAVKVRSHIYSCIIFSHSFDIMFDKPGPDSGKIVIWNMGPVVTADKENDENSPKILCQMDHHIGNWILTFKQIR